MIVQPIIEAKVSASRRKSPGIGTRSKLIPLVAQSVAVICRYNDRKIKLGILSIF